MGVLLGLEVGEGGPGEQETDNEVGEDRVVD
jgi:hypothetical protein